MTALSSGENTSVFFQKGDDRIIVWTNNCDRWTVTDMRTQRTRRYTRQLAMALSAALVAEGYQSTVHHSNHS